MRLWTDRIRWFREKATFEEIVAVAESLFRKRALHPSWATFRLRRMDATEQAAGLTETLEAQVTPALAACLEGLAARQGMTAQQLAGEVLRRGIFALLEGGSSPAVPALAAPAATPATVVGKGDDGASLESIGLKPKATKKLERAKVHTVGELAAMTRHELINIPRLGPAILSHIEECLANHGRRLAA